MCESWHREFKKIDISEFVGVDLNDYAKEFRYGIPRIVYLNAKGCGIDLTPFKKTKDLNKLAKNRKIFLKLMEEINWGVPPEWKDYNQTIKKFRGLPFTSITNISTATIEADLRLKKLLNRLQGRIDEQASTDKPFSFMLRIGCNGFYKIYFAHDLRQCSYEMKIETINSHKAAMPRLKTYFSHVYLMVSEFDMKIQLRPKRGHLYTHPKYQSGKFDTILNQLNDVFVELEGLWNVEIIEHPQKRNTQLIETIISRMVKMYDIMDRFEQLREQLRNINQYNAEFEDPDEENCMYLSYPRVDRK